MDEEQYLGYLKYTGKSIENGLLDTRKSAEALMGFDEILRFFLLNEDPSLSLVEFEIPVRIKKGSWEALIPTGLAIWFAKDYLSAVAKKAGDEGFLETGPAKDIDKIFKSSLKSLQWIIRIASHVGTLTKKKFENIKFRNNNTEIGIPNDQNEYIYVPRKYFDMYEKCPEKILSKNSRIIEKERVLEFGVIENGEVQSVSITEKEKYIFYSEQDDDIVLPELIHNQLVELDGEITRATESTNTIGFRYNGHTIVCKPKSGNIAQFKGSIVSQEDDHLFPKVKLKGIVDRTDKHGGFKEKRPQIIFSEIISIEGGIPRQSLFN